MVVLAQSLGQFEETVAAVQRFVPRLLAFVAVLAVGYLIARWVGRAVAAVLHRAGFERAVRRSGLHGPLARSGYDAADVLARIAYYGLMLFVLQLAFAVFGPNPVSASLSGVIAFLPRLFVAIVIVVLAAAVATAVREIVTSLLGGLASGRALALSAYALILGIGVFAALDQLQVAPTIVNGVFYATLAVVVGVTVVAVGGGGIAPMRQRWELALARVDEEAVRIREATEEHRARRAADEQEERLRLAQQEHERQAQLEREEQQRRAEHERQERQAQLAHDQQAQYERDQQEHQARYDRDQQERRAQLEREEQQRRVVRELEEHRQQQVFADEHEREPVTQDLDVFEQDAGHPAPAAYDPFEDEREATDPPYPRPDDRRRLRTASRHAAQEPERPPIRYRESMSNRGAHRYARLDDERDHTRPIDQEQTRPMGRAPWDDPAD
ncbi:MAG TPA: hypothetical protein VK875_09325 [Euzebyales bacterium]|nr:hypothetical protein [Euzebyales bacterium]